MIEQTENGPVIRLPDNCTVVSCETVVGGKARGTTTHVEHCHDGFLEVGYKRDQFMSGLNGAGDKMQAEAISDIKDGQLPVWDRPAIDPRRA